MDPTRQQSDKQFVVLRIMIYGYGDREDDYKAVAIIMRYCLAGWQEVIYRLEKDYGASRFLTCVRTDHVSCVPILEYEEIERILTKCGLVKVELPVPSFVDDTWQRKRFYKLDGLKTTGPVWRLRVKEGGADAEFVECDVDH